jgi:hypothetical protein
VLQDIAWEGMNSLSLEELQLACSTRGMRANLDRALLDKQLGEWLELSKQDVPTSLMILSRIFMITHDARPGECPQNYHCLMCVCV